MISKANLEEQLKKINFNTGGWGKGEIKELRNVLIPGEELDECVNGMYEAGFALLAATGDRLLLIDKKPLNYLIVEDLRFDMINEFDYGHRLIGAEIHLSTGMKTLHFRSWNQSKLRRLYGFVQYRMTEFKKLQRSHQEAQKFNLEQMNQQLQLYLALQQYQYQRASLAGVDTNTLISGMGTYSHHISPGQVGLAAMKRVIPIVSAYARLPFVGPTRRVARQTLGSITPQPLG